MKLKKINIKTNKGIQLNQLVSVVLTLIIVTILVIIGLRITSGTQDAIKDDCIASISNWTTASATTGEWVELPHNDLSSLGAVANATYTGEILPPANITTIDLTHGKFIFTDTSFNTTLNVTYSYYCHTSAYNASDAMAGSIVEISSWGDLIGLAVAAGVILTIILGAFAFRQ